MALYSADPGVITDAADFGWKMRRSILAILNLRGLLDIKVECQKDRGDPGVPLRGESWAGPG